MNVLSNTVIAKYAARQIVGPANSHYVVGETCLIPCELLNYRQWVAYTPTKIPLDPLTGRGASSTDPATWGTFAAAKKFARERGLGIGFVFTEDDPYMGIDVDDCFDEEGNISQEALGLLNLMDSYAELSPSGSGLHILVRAKLPATGQHPPGLGLYDSRRYFTMTGRQFPGTRSSIELRQPQVDYLYRQVCPAPPSNGHTRYSQPNGRQKISAADLARALQATQTGPQQWMACCPAHDDRTPSLSITEVQGKTLVHCFSHCTQQEVIRSLKEKGLW